MGKSSDGLYSRKNRAVNIVLIKNIDKMNNQNLVLFESKQVRRFYDNEKDVWYFSVIDVVEILTGSSIPKRYWSDLKKKLVSEGSEVYEKIVRLKMEAPLLSLVCSESKSVSN